MIEGILVMAAVGIDAVLAVFFVLRLRRSLTNYRSPSLDSGQELRKEELPTVSICIPARNEKHAMTQCLERVLASDYEKIEIIVFDDSSDDETSILIRSFAHAGVRFVPGTELPEGWLGKNHALDILAHEASGKYLIFMDVDAFIAPTTISRLMTYAVLMQKTMISVIPGRQDVWRASVLFSPLRYFWQLILATVKEPATSGALWMIDRDVLFEQGGLEGYRHEVQAEAYIAAKLSSSYQCLVENGTLGVNYEKKWSSQAETSRRMLYPMMRGWKSLTALSSLLILNVPSVVLLGSFIFGWTIFQTCSLIVLIFFMCIYALYTHAVWRGNWWLGGLLWPIIILQESVLFALSMIGYARHTITWKGRSVTAPVERIDHLEIDR